MSAIRMSAFIGGMQFAVIRKLLIRPFFHFEDRRIQNVND